MTSTGYAQQTISGSVGMGGNNIEGDVLTIQVLLNQVPESQGGPDPILDPDGEVGPATLSAIATFQKKHFESADSRVDPNGQTLAKLNQVVNAQSFSHRVSRVAFGEREFWRNGGRSESETRVASRLQAYWAVVGRRVTAEQLQDKKFQNDNPWSAVCISWIIKQAGGGSDFKYSSAHRVYTADAKANRVNGGPSPFKAFNATESMPAVGDIVVQGRGGEIVTFENIDNGALHQTHGDIVVSIENGMAITIGGNVGDSVRITEVALNDDGTIASNRYFAIIKRE